MHSFKPLITASAALFSTAFATTSFNPSASNNVAVYWGQGPGQGPLANVCANPNIDIVIISFIDVFPDQGPGGWPGDNFGDACGASYYNNANGIQTALLSYCPQIGPDIATCQGLGTKVLLSIGGGYPVDYWINNSTSAVNFADFLWGAFGPQTQSWVDAGMPRPFGDSCVDGFDFDIESNLYGAIPNDAYGNPIPDYQSRGYADMITEFQTLFAATGKKYYISGAPQCVIPDAHLAPAIQNSWFDFLFVQFYNTAQCSARAGVNYTEGIGTDNISFEQWTQVTSLNPNVKVYLGLPASPSAASGGSEYYLTPSEVYELASQYYSNPKFGGIMLWEATYSQNNQICGQEYATWMKLVMDGCVGGSFSSACPSSSSSSSVVSSTTSSVWSSSSSIVVTTSSAASSSSSQSSSSWAPVTSSSTTSSVVSVSSPTSSTSSAPSVSSPASPTCSAPYPTGTDVTCPDNDGSLWQDPATGDVFQIACGISYAGCDMPGAPIYESDLVACMSYCASTPGCQAIAWVDGAPQGPCYYKSCVGTGVPQEGVFGASLVSTGTGPVTCGSSSAQSSSVSSVWSPSSSPAGPTVTSSSSSSVWTPSSSSQSSSESSSSSSQSSSIWSQSSSAQSSSQSSSASQSSSVWSPSSSPAGPTVTSSQSSSVWSQSQSQSSNASQSSSVWSPSGSPTGPSSVWQSSSSLVSSSVPLSSSSWAPSSSPSSVYSSSVWQSSSSPASSSVPQSSSSPASPILSSTTSSVPSSSRYQSSPWSSAPASSSSSSSQVSGVTPTTSSVSIPWTTSTIYSTTVITVTSCGPEVTNCPAHPEQQTSTTVITSVIAISTTVCPVTETSASPVWTTSTVYSTQYITITACPPGTPNCPAEQKTTTVSTTVVPVSTTVCPVSSPAGAGAGQSVYSSTTEVVSTMSVIPVPASQYYSSLSAAEISPAGGKAAVPSSSAVKPVYGSGSGNGTVSFAPTGGYGGSKTSVAPVSQFTGAATKVGGQGVLVALMVGGLAVLM